LIRYVPSGIYFSRIRVQGKLIRHPQKNNKLAGIKFLLYPCDGRQDQIAEPLIAEEIHAARFWVGFQNVVRANKNRIKPVRPESRPGTHASGDARSREICPGGVGFETSSARSDMAR